MTARCATAVEAYPGAHPAFAPMKRGAFGRVLQPNPPGSHWVTVDSLHLTLPATPASIAAARRALAPLREDVGDPVFRDLRLLVSEVVTNAIRHAEHRGEVRLVVVPLDGVLRVEVHDGGVGFLPDPEPSPAPDKAAGWGLYLVDKLTRRWGTERSPDAHVWFELER